MELFLLLYSFKEEFFTNKIKKYGEANEQYVKSDTVTNIESYADIMEKDAPMSIVAWEMEKQKAEIKKARSQSEEVLASITAIEAGHNSLAAKASPSFSPIPEPAEDFQRSCFEEDEGVEE